MKCASLRSQKDHSELIGTSVVGFVHNYVMLPLLFSPISLICYQYFQCIFIIFYGITFIAINIKIGRGNKLIPSVLFIKFLGLTVDCSSSWRIHVDHLATKLSASCYVIRSIKPLTYLIKHYYLCITISFIQSCSME
jgi:hypothetical protein